MVIELNKEYGFLQPCTLECRLHGDKPRPAMLIFPGGGYYLVSPREGEPVASRFYEEGFNTFILNYSTADRAKGVYYPMQLLQASAAILYIRKNSAKLLSTDDVITCGFSAGGHLAAMTAVYYDREVVLKTFGIAGNEAKPSAAVLCYAVLSSINFPHVGSFENLTGSKNPKDHMLCSTEFAVDKNTPPVFLWHTSEDKGVNAANSICFADRLSQAGVPFELHIFEKGPHGLSMCDETTSGGKADYENPDTAKWFDLCSNWLKKRFHI